MRISDWSSDVCSSDLSAFDIKFAFNKWTLGDAFCRDVLGLTDAQLDDMSFDMLAALGFTRAEIDAANTYVCGAMTVEGAPHLKVEHLPVFDCAKPSGRIGKRSLSDRTRVVKGKSVSVRIDLGGRRFIKKKKQQH